MVATLLGYGEPQVLESFKNTLPSRLYWVLFTIEDLRQVVETAKRILNKEIDRHPAGQTSSTPFMNTWKGYNSNKKTISFDTQNSLDDKIDKLTSMMSKLSTQDSNKTDHLSIKYIKVKGKAGLIMAKIDIEIATDQTVEIDIIDYHIEVDLSVT